MRPEVDQRFGPKKRPEGFFCAETHANRCRKVLVQTVQHALRPAARLQKIVEQQQIILHGVRHGRVLQFRHCAAERAGRTGKRGK